LAPPPGSSPGQALPIPGGEGWAAFFRDRIVSLICLGEDDALLAGFAAVDAGAGFVIGGVEGDEGDASDCGFGGRADGVFGFAGAIPVSDDESATAFLSESSLELFPGIDTASVFFTEFEGAGIEFGLEMI